jgi:hypothetical protein
MDDQRGQNATERDKQAPENAARSRPSTHASSDASLAEAPAASTPSGTSDGGASRYAPYLGQQDEPQPIRSQVRVNGSPEGHEPQAPAQAEDDAPASRSLRVTTPAEAPDLTPGAARALLRVLLSAAGKQGIVPPDSADQDEK